MTWFKLELRVLTVYNTSNYSFSLLARLGGGCGCVYLTQRRTAAPTRRTLKSLRSSFKTNTRRRNGEASGVIHLTNPLYKHDINKSEQQLFKRRIKAAYLCGYKISGLIWPEKLATLLALKSTALELCTNRFIGWYKQFLPRASCCLFNFDWGLLHLFKILFQALFQK